jgi:HSP20 family protein
MSLAKWEPLREIEDIFERYTRGLSWPLKRGQELISAGDWSPRVDISENDNEFEIRAEIPDVKKEDVKVTVNKGVVTIQGERRQEKEEKGKKFHRVERHYGNFVRSFTLPDNIDEKKVKASYKDGILNLRIPKTAEAKAKSVEVKVE